MKCTYDLHFTCLVSYISVRLFSSCFPMPGARRDGISLLIGLMMQTLVFAALCIFGEGECCFMINHSDNLHVMMAIS